MSVNESLWGNKSTWAQYRVHNTDITNVLISNNQTLESINGNVAQSPNIDLSCSPWGIGGGSWLCNTFVGSAWIQVTGDNPYNKPLGYATQYYNCDKNAGKQHPMILLSNQDITGTQRNKGSVVMFSQNRYYPDANAESPSYLGKQAIVHDAERDGYALKPILQFDYKNLILIPYVIAYKGAIYYQILLDDFCNNSADITKTDNIAGWREQGIHITGIGYKFAFGNAGNRNSTTDDENEIFNVATIRALAPYDIKDTSTVNLPAPMGNIPQEAYYVTISSCQQLNGNDVVLSTMLSNTDYSRKITMYRDVNSQPFTYWYDGIARDNSNPFTPEAACYMTGGDNFAYEAHLYWSTDIPAYYNDALRYMYFDITDLSDDDVRKELWRQVAYLGFVFTKDHTQINGVVGSDNNLCMPVFTNGVTTGDYKQGEDIRTLPNFLWTTDVFDKNKYNPYDDDDKGNESDSGKLNNSLYRNIRLGGSNYFYALSETELHNFINFVNGMYINESDDTKLKLDFKGSNPNDYIVGVYAYPFNIPNTPHESNIYIGCVESTVNANVVRQTDTGYFTFGTLVVEPYYNDFRDYAPYTQIEIYIPLCGTVELDTAFYMGHTITIDGIYDINTGALTVRILRDNEIDRTFDGSIAVQIPVTARNMGEYQNNIHQLRMNLINAAVSGVTAGEKAITGGIASAMQSYGANNPMSAMSESSLDIGATAYMSGQNISNAKYNLSHTQPRVSVTSTASSANAFQMYNKAILFIKRAKMLDNFDPEKYGKTIGYACLMNKQLSEVSGFTVCANADLSGIPATADEINAIQAALQSGLYL